MEKILHLVSFSILLQTHGVHSEIVGASVIGHVDAVWDARSTNFSLNTERFRTSQFMLGHRLSTISPEIILLTTPHSLALDRDYVFLRGTQASGYAQVGLFASDPPFESYKVPVSVELDDDVSADLVEHLRLNGGLTNVHGLSPWINTEPVPLRWAEAYPLLYLQPAVQNAKIVFMAHPSRMTTDPKGMIPELQQIGQSMYHYLEALEERIVIVVTSDCAHNHPSESANRIDKATASWAQTQNTNDLTGMDSADLIDAFHDGYTGLVMLDALLKEAPYPWVATLYDYYIPDRPTGGPSSLAASFIPITKKGKSD